MTDEINGDGLFSSLFHFPETATTTKTRAVSTSGPEGLEHLLYITSRKSIDRHFAAKLHQVYSSNVAWPTGRAWIEKSIRENTHLHNAGTNHDRTYSRNGRYTISADVSTPPPPPNSMHTSLEPQSWINGPYSHFLHSQYGAWKLIPLCKNV